MSRVISCACNSVILDVEIIPFKRINKSFQVYSLSEQLQQLKLQNSDLGVTNTREQGPS